MVLQKLQQTPTIFDSTAAVSPFQEYARILGKYQQFCGPVTVK
jgi:hypothetical protein